MSQRVSVIIPTYNYGLFIADAIRSVLAQTYTVAEIVVVDDGSSDDTAAVVAGFGGEVKYIRQENAGVCAARNRGVLESTGEFVAFLDADDTWEPETAAKLIGKFKSNPEFGLVHCGTREFDGETGETIRLNLSGAEDDLVENLLLWKEPGMPGPGGAIMLRREAFDLVGGLDTRLKCGEDWDFCYRIARVFKVGFVPETLVNYRIHRAAAHNNVEEMERGMTLFYEKAFATKDPAVLRLRRRSYSNFHRVMAGSYFRAGRYAKFLGHTLRSLFQHPSSLTYFLQFPFRRFR